MCVHVCVCGIKKLLSKRGREREREADRRRRAKEGGVDCVIEQ